MRNCSPCSIANAATTIESKSFGIVLISIADNPFMPKSVHMPKAAPSKELRVRIDPDLVHLVLETGRRDRDKAPRVVNRIVAAFFHARRK